MIFIFQVILSIQVGCSQVAAWARSHGLPPLQYHFGAYYHDPPYHNQYPLHHIYNPMLNIKDAAPTQIYLPPFLAGTKTNALNGLNTQRPIEPHYKPNQKENKVRKRNNC